MSTFLITGGAGFIGSHLSETLLGLGHRVNVLDDLSTGRLTNVKRLQSHPGFTFVQGDVADAALIDDLVEASDGVFHLAASVGVFNILEYPAESIVNNIDGTRVLLAAAVRRRTRVLLASSSEVYGKNCEPPFRETADIVFGEPTKSRWSYASSKLVDEYLGLAAWKEQKVPVVVVRLFNTIGPRQLGCYGMVVPRLFGQAMSGASLTVYGDGCQTRCFTYVSDIVEWLIRLSGTDEAVGEIFNLGNPQEISITDLAKRVIHISRSKASIEYIPYEQAYSEDFEDTPKRVPDISKVVRVTGYMPRVGLDESLHRIHRWMCQETPAEFRKVEPAPAFLPDREAFSA